MAIQAPYGMAQSQSPPCGDAAANRRSRCGSTTKACCLLYSHRCDSSQPTSQTHFTIYAWILESYGHLKPPRRLRKVCLLLGWSAVFPAVSSWLDSPLHRVRANSPESKLLEGGHAPDQATGGRRQKRRSMKTGKPPVARLLSGAACCQAARCLIACVVRYWPRFAGLLHSSELWVFPKGAAGFLSNSDPHAPVVTVSRTDRPTVWQLRLLKSRQR